MHQSEEMSKLMTQHFRTSQMKLLPAAALVSRKRKHSCACVLSGLTEHEIPFWAWIQIEQCESHGGKSIDATLFPMHCFQMRVYVCCQQLCSKSSIFSVSNTFQQFTCRKCW